MKSCGTEHAYCYRKLKDTAKEMLFMGTQTCGKKIKKRKSQVSINTVVRMTDVAGMQAWEAWKESRVSSADKHPNS